MSHLHSAMTDSSTTPGTSNPIGFEPSAPGFRSVLTFRRFRVYPTSRRLLRNGDPVEIGSRAFDLLMVLLLARGSIVSKEEIFRYVWPSTIVDECNLRFQTGVLRRALGEDRDVVKTIPGRGYFFAEEVHQTVEVMEVPPLSEGVARTATTASSEPAAQTHLAARPTEAGQPRAAERGLEGLISRATLTSPEARLAAPAALGSPSTREDETSTWSSNLSGVGGPANAGLADLLSEVARLPGAPAVHVLGDVILIIANRSV